MSRTLGAACLAFVLATATAADARAEDYSFGASVRGYGGIVSADSSLGTGIGRDEPDPLKGHDLRAAGVRGAGGFGGGFFFALHEIRFGFDATAFFNDAYRLSYTPLANGFTATSRTAVHADFDLFFGRMFAIGDFRPYVDLKLGVSWMQTSVRLENPAFGLVGETDYNAVRLLLAPRAGVLVPLGSGLYVDTGAEVGLLGFTRLVGFAGIGVRLGSDQRLPIR